MDNAGILVWNDLVIVAVQHQRGLRGRLLVLAQKKDPGPGSLRKTL